MSFDFYSGTVLVPRRVARRGGEGGLSATWRRHGAAAEGAELALVLRALRKVAGHLGRSVRPLQWRGLTETGERAILLDPAEVRGACPVSPDTLDALVGEVVAEAYRDLEWSEWVERQVCRDADLAAGKAGEYLPAMMAAGECLFAVTRSRGSVWHEYLKSYWKQHLAREVPRAAALPPSPDSLARVWFEAQYLGALPPSLHPYYHDAFPALRQLAGELLRIATEPAAAARRQRRVAAYAGTWSVLQRALAEWEGYRPQAGAIGLHDEAGPRVGLDGRAGEAEAEWRDPTAPQPEVDAAEEEEQLAAEVRQRLGEGPQRMTDQLRQVASSPDGVSLETVVSRGVAPCGVVPDGEGVGRLRQVFERHRQQLRRRQRRRTRRFLEAGAMDGRRLHRAQVDGRIFKQRQWGEPETQWHIVVVADASASMVERRGGLSPWEVAEATFAALAAAVRGFAVQAQVLAYSERDGRCELTSLLDGEELFTVYPAGRTPSGHALLAAALRLQQDDGQRLLVHLTDGEANRGTLTEDAVGYCQRHGIGLYTLAHPRSATARRELRQCYGDTVRFLASAADLQRALEDLLESALLGGAPA